MALCGCERDVFAVVPCAEEGQEGECDVDNEEDSEDEEGICVVGSEGTDGACW